MKRGGPFVWFFAVFALSCGRGAPAPVKHAVIGANIVARAGGAPIAAPLVAGVARARSEDADTALDSLLRDALLAEGARARKMDLESTSTRDLTALRARLVADKIAADAKRGGPCTDAEVDELSKIHKSDVDAPEQVRVIHAIALRPKKQDESENAKARAVAGAIARAVAGATSDNEFETRAKAVAHDGVDVRVESLPPFAEDGTIARGGSMDSIFAKAAYDLASPGDLSPVVETSFGWHVIRLDERIPARNVPREKRRSMFGDECASRRARAAFMSLIATRRAATVVEIARDAPESMAAVVGAPSSP